MLTIVTPSFNHARWLRQCIDSVHQQGWPDVQHVVIDGGSTDGSIEILRSYGDAITWTSARDRGQAEAVNRGLRQARGETIGWLNSDDYYLPGAFAHAAAYLEAHPEADLIYGRALLVDEDGRPIRPYPTFELKRRDLRRTCSICQPAVFLRRRTIERFGLLDERLDICLDYEWWLRISRTGTMVFCNELLAASRLHASAKTVSRRSRALVEAGALMREHFGAAPARWAAKWAVHRYRLARRGGRGAVAAAAGAAVAGWRYLRRFRRGFSQGGAQDRSSSQRPVFLSQRPQSRREEERQG